MRRSLSTSDGLVVWFQILVAQQNHGLSSKRKFFYVVFWIRSKVKLFHTRHLNFSSFYNIGIHSSMSRRNSVSPKYKASIIDFFAKKRETLKHFTNNFKTPASGCFFSAKKKSIYKKCFTRKYRSPFNTEKRRVTNLVFHC